MFISATKAAKILGTTPPTVIRWVKEGRFPNARSYVGADKTTYRIPVTDIHDYIANAETVEAS